MSVPSFGVSTTPIGVLNSPLVQWHFSSQSVPIQTITKTGSSHSSKLL
jgi:hypothetical protein